MTLNQILQDIHGLDERLRILEEKYTLLSEDMYALYRLGELEQTEDIIRWVGYYELRQARQRAYVEAQRARLLSLRKETSSTLIQLHPDSVS